MLEAEISDADLKLAQPTLITKLASAVQGIAGLWFGLSGFQILGIRFREPALQPLPYLIIAIGIAQIPLAAMIYRNRSWAAILSGILGPVATLLAGFWLVYGLSGGIFSCLSFLSVPFELGTAVLVALAFGAVRRAQAARDRLAESGMSLGL